MTGSRRGSRKGTRESAPGVRRVALRYGALLTLALVAWGVLVWLAVRFGAVAMDGRPAGWAWMGLAGLGAVACLFLAFLLVARVALALTEPAPRADAPVGGRRAAR